jgi:nucleoside-diphosphate-sugar epimerase
MKALVFGGTGMVGELIVERLMQSGHNVVGVSRGFQTRTNWISADLARPEALQVPKVDVIFSAAPAELFAKALHRTLRSEPARMVVLSSTSIFTKIESSDADERASIQRLISAEQQIIDQSKALNVEWTILRPTLIYKEGRDQNVTRIANTIRRFGFIPLCGSAAGLRQPIHAEDMAIGAIAAAKSPKAANADYTTTGFETIPYHEMVGRIFDGLALPRRGMHLPPPVWKSIFALAKPLFPMRIRGRAWHNYRPSSPR